MQIYSPNLPLFSIHVPKMGGTSFTAVLEQWFNKTNLFDLTTQPRFRKILRKTRTENLFQKSFKCGLWYHYKNHKFNQSPPKVIFGHQYGIFKRELIPECIHGHFSLEDDGFSLLDTYPFAKQFITVLRDPLKSHVSLYYYSKKLIAQNGFIYWQGKKIYELAHNDINDWVLNYPFFMLRFFPYSFTLENFETIIQDNFVHVCVLENYQQSINILAKKLGFNPIQVPSLNSNSIKIKEETSQNTIDIFRKKYHLEYLIYEFALTLNQ